MEKSKVYFSDMHATEDLNLPQKFERLLRKAGMMDIDFQESRLTPIYHVPPSSDTMSELVDYENRWKYEEKNRNHAYRCCRYGNFPLFPAS